MNIIKKLLENQNGTKVKLSGVAGKLLKVANGDKFVFEPDETDDCEVFSRNNVIDMFGKTLFAVDDRVQLLNQAPLTTESIEELARRSAYVSRVKLLRTDDKIGGVNFLKAVTNYVAKEIGDPCPPSRTALIEWCKITKKNTAGVRATLPSRTRKRRSSFDENTLDLALACIDDHYLTLSRPTMQYGYDCFVDEFKKAFQSNKKIPHYKTFTKWIKELPHAEVILAREGKRALKAAKRNKTSMLITDHILERVEVDAVHFSLGVIDEEGNYLGKVVVYFVIDCHSRSVMGYKMQIGTGETASSVIDSYRHAILQKDPSLVCPEIINTWPMCGLIEIVVFDGGPGYTANTTIAFLMDLGSTCQLAQTGCGWKKPYIERFFGTLRKQLLQTIPGYCKRVKDVRELDLSLEKQASITPAQLENLITQWIVDEYHQTPHKGLGGRTPQQVWESQASMYVMLPANEDELRLQQGDFVFRTISGDSSEAGVVNNKIRYNEASGRLQEIGQMKKSLGESATIQILYNNNDISRVSALDEETGELLELIALDPRITEGMSLAEYKALFSTKEYSNKGFGHHRATKDNPVRTVVKEIHDKKMNASRRKTPRGADLTTLDNTTTAEQQVATDEVQVSKKRKLPTIKAHKDA